MNYPEVESTVQYSTVQYDVKNVTEGREGKGRREGDQAQFFTWIQYNKSSNSKDSPVFGSVCYPYLNEILAIKFSSLLQITNSSAVGNPSWTKICT